AQPPGRAGRSPRRVLGRDRRRVAEHAGMTAVENEATTGIELRGLVKSFRTPDGVVQAVREVDIEIGIGETLALLGPNGAGKSTTIDMLLGLTTPDVGSVSLFGL